MLPNPELHQLRDAQGCDLDIYLHGRCHQIAIERANSVARLHEGVANGQLKDYSKREASSLNDGDL